MLDLIGAIAGMTAVAINLVAFTGVLPGSLARRLILAAIGGAWVGLASGLGAAGKLAFSPQQPVPLVGVLFAVPLLTVGALALRYAKVRSTLLAIPMPLLISLNALRVLGVLFLLLAAAGRLSGPFPYSAGWGDIITGAFAIPLALRVARSQKLPVVGDPFRGHRALLVNSRQVSAARRSSALPPTILRLCEPHSWRSRSSRSRRRRARTQATPDKSGRCRRSSLSLRTTRTIKESCSMGGLARALPAS